MQIRGNTQIMPSTISFDRLDASLQSKIGAGVDFKASCRVATTGNITLSGTQTIDGVALSVGDRVLVKNQSTGSQNGIYVVASGAWSRATDADDNIDVTAGMTCWVTEGTVNADTQWVLITDDPIVVGTTALSFTQVSGLGQIVAGAGLTKTGNTLDAGAGLGIQVNADDIQVKLDSNSQLVLGAGGLKVTPNPTFTSVTVSDGQDIGTISALGGSELGVSVGGIVQATDRFRLFRNSNIMDFNTETLTSGRLVTFPNRNGTVLLRSDHVTEEVPSGAINGSNVTFTLANAPISGTVKVFLNGIRQKLTTHFTVSGTTLTLAAAPVAGDTLVVEYLK